MSKAEKTGVNNVGSIIYSLRTNKEMTQKELAKELNISEGLISHYERGRNELPNDVMVKYADFFDVSADYILNRCHSKFNYTKYVDKTVADDYTIGDVLDAVLKMSKKEKEAIITIIKCMNKDR